MKKTLLFLLLITFSIFSFSQNFIPGYTKTIKGDDFEYHSPQPDAGTSMLIRSQDSRDYIEWETAPVPNGKPGEGIKFLMLAGIDVNAEDPHSWDIYVNGLKYFTISSPTNLNRKEYK